MSSTHYTHYPGCPASASPQTKNRFSAAMAIPIWVILSLGVHLQQLSIQHRHLQVQVPHLSHHLLSRFCCTFSPANSPHAASQPGPCKPPADTRSVHARLVHARSVYNWLFKGNGSGSECLSCLPQPNSPRTKWGCLFLTR